MLIRELMDRPSEKPIQVYAAAAANAIIATSKLIAAGATGSSAMLSEGIHSIADTGNQLLMVLGLRRSRRAADSVHPFGSGQEVYFWSFVVAMILFSLGGGMSLYEGIRRLKNSEGISAPFWNYLVLALAAIVESASLAVALRKFKKSIRPGESWWTSFRTSKDPTVSIVIAEDVAALMGIAVAAAGIVLGQIFKSGLPDAIAAMMIGVILGCVALLMAMETHQLLLGESADPETVSEIMEIAAEDGTISRVDRPLTMHFGPDEILVNMAVEFRGGTSGESILSTIAKLEDRIRQRFPRVRRIFIEAGGLKSPDAASDSATFHSNPEQIERSRRVR